MSALRKSAAFRIAARVLIWVLTVMSVWSIAPPVPLAARAQAPAPPPAQTVTFSGPQTFTRTKGRPDVFTLTVNVPSGVGGPFTLHVQNGEPDRDAGVRATRDDDDDDEGYDDNDRRDHYPAPHRLRVTNAELAINGQTVASRPDFRRHTPGFDKPVNLTSRSTMTVTMRGKPTCFIVVSLLGRTLDRRPPRITLAAPAPNTVVASSTPRIVVDYADVAAAGAAASGVDPATFAVRIDGIDRSALFTRGAGQAVGQLTAAEALADGTHALIASIADRAGNAGTAIASVRVDTVAPVVAIVQPGLDVYTAQASVDVRGTVADGSPVSIAVNGVTAAVDGTSFTAAGVPLGAGPEVPLRVVATDAAGHVSESVRTVHVDRVSPTVQIAQPAPGSYVRGAAVVSGSVSDVSPVTVTVNGVAAAMNGAAFTATLPSPNGLLLIHVAAADAAGNTGSADANVTVDSLAPALALTSPADGFVTNQAATRVSGSVTDTTPVTITVNGSPVPVTGGAFAVDLPLSPGANTITVTAADAAGNVTSTIVRGLLDQSAPTLQIAAPANGAYLATATPAIRVAYQDDGTIDARSLQILIDGQDRTALFTSAAGEASATVPALGDGAHQVTATVSDAAANRTTVSSSFFTDTTGPVVQIAEPAADAYVKGPAVAVRGSVSDLAVESVTVNGAAAAVGNGTFTAMISATDGPLAITVVATDVAGNRRTATATITVDSVAPVLTIGSPASGVVTNQTSVRVQGSVNDSSPVTLTIGGVGVPVTSNTFSYDASLASEGVATIAFAATDAAGNVGNTSVSVTVDRTAPAIQINSPAAGAVLRGPSVTVTGTIADASAATVSVNGVVASLSGPTFTATLPVTDGAVILEATATDVAGNTSSASTAMTLDSVSPVITVLQPADGQYTNASEIEVSVGVSDTTAVTVTFNGVAAAASGSTFTATVPLGSGADVVIVATDAAGNTSQQSLSLHVDRVPPTIAIGSPAAGAYRKGPILDVAGSVSDASAVSVEVNGQMATVADGVFAAQVPAGDGPLTIQAIARDAAGNTATAQRDVIIDSLPPAISVSSPASGSITNQQVAHVTGTVADVSPVTVRVGAAIAPVSDGAFAADVPLGSDGDRTITLRATDAAGNESTFDVHLTLDQTPPDLQINSPAAGAMLGGLPAAVQGLVYDATATTVTVNGVPASRVQDAWQAAVGGLSEGPQLFTVTATDAAGNTRTVTRTVTIDLTSPAITISSPAADALTRTESIQVTGTASDATLTSVVVNGVAAVLTAAASGFDRMFAANLALVEGDNHLIAVATDALGRVSQTEVVVTRDSTPPTVSIVSPDTLSPRRGGTATIAASDNVGLASVVATLDGAAVGNSAAAPFAVALAVPAGAPTGATLTLVATATDRAGNTATASHTVRVLSDGGVVVGQVLSDVTGLPIAGATVTMIGGSSGAGGSGEATTTDERGGYSLFSGDDSVLASITRGGMTTVERQVPIQSGVGTAVVDARLTPLAPPAPVTAGGAVTAGNVSLTLPGAASLAITRLSAQGLPALLPLGWSPLAEFDVRGDVQPASAVVSSFSRTDAVAVTYRASTHGWFVVARQVTVDADGRASFAIPGAGAYALVVPDAMTPPIPVPDAGQPLTGVSLTLLPATATATGTFSPATLPPAGGTAAGSLAIQSPVPLASGTVIQAQVTETYTLASGVTASEEQRSEDIVLYRSPAVDVSAVSGFSRTPELSAFFPITPTRTYQTSTLTTGAVQLDILAGREEVRGQTGGSEPLSIDAGGGVIMTVPAHALPADTAVRVQPAILSSFLPGAAPNTAPSDVVPVGEVVVDFASQQLTLSAELSISASAATSSVMSGFSQTTTYLLGRVVRLDGIAHVLVVARAEVAGDRLVSRALVGLPGITVSGRYVFYRVGGDVGFVAGILSASGTPVAGIIESDSLPFVGMAGADGRFVIAARAADVRLTGRVAGTALQGTATVTVPVGAITSRDVVLAGAVTTAIVTPANGATLVQVSAQLEIAASAPLDASAVTGAAIALTAVGSALQTGQNDPVAIRRVLAGSGRVLALVPDAALAAATTYRLDVSGLADVYGGAVLVPPVSFTTKADTAAVFDPEQVTVSFPDDNGTVHVTAPPGVVPPLTHVLVINAGNGIVASFEAGNDGSMNSQLTASIRDRLIVTITDPQGRSFSFERNTYVAADGTTGVGSGGGKVKSATTDAEIQIPEGAIDDSAVFKLDGVDLSTFFPDDPSMADLLGATVASSIKIEAPADLSLNQEAKLAFAKPAGAPPGAFYFVYRRLQGPDGLIAYETIDEAAEDPKTGKIITASPPFGGFVNSIDTYGFGGVDAVGGASYATMMYLEALMPGKAAMGVITGKVLRQVFDPGAPTPHYEGVRNAMVSGVDAGGQPLAAKTTGANAAISQKDGTFTLFDLAYQGGTVTLSATVDGETKTATAYESNPQDLKSPGLGKYRNIATANITYPAKAPGAPPAAIAIKVFTTVNGALKETAVVVAGTPVAFGFKADNATVTSATVQGASLAVRADTSNVTKLPQMADGYTPAAPGSYTVSASALPAFGPPVVASATFRVIASGGSAVANLPNDPPAVVTGLTVPSANATGVEPSVFLQVTFTEPVKNLPQHVLLQGGGGTVPVTLSGDGPDGPVETITTGDQVVTSLTIQPLQPLLYNTTYTLQLTSGIVDLDTDVNSQPAPKALPPYTTTFTTFGPEQIGQSAESYSSPAIVVLGDRGYLTVPLPNRAGLKIYDVSDPTALKELLPSQPVTAIGYPYDLAGEEASPLTGGRIVAMTTGPIFVPYRPSNVFVYDVATDQPQWIGAVTLGNSPSDGVARRTVMKDGVLYAATAGIGKGIQIVDLNLAISNVQAATANGTSSPEYYRMLSQLGLEGQGFGQDAISNTIFVDTGSAQNSRLWDLAVGDIAVDGTQTRLVVATGASALAIVDPATTEILCNGRVMKVDGSPALVWGYSVGLTKIGTRDIAVLVGFNSGASNIVLVTVDVSDPRHPFAIGSLPLSPSQVDQRARLLVDDRTVYVGGQSGTTVVDVSDPQQPRITGIINGVSANLALTADGLLFGIGSPMNPRESGGLKSAATTEAAVIKTISPFTTTSDAQGRSRIGADVRIDVELVPHGVSLAAAHVDILNGVTVVETLAAIVSDDSSGFAIWPANRPILQNAAYYARAGVEDSRGRHLQSAPKPIPLIDHVVDLRIQGLRPGTEAAPNELDPGAVLVLNNDDDNKNRIPDLQEAAVAGEDDLVEVKLSVTTALGAGSAVLDAPAGADRIKVWSDRAKTALIPNGTAWRIGQDTLPASLYLEGVRNSDAPRDVTLRLRFTPDAQSGRSYADTVAISVVEVDLDVDTLNQKGLATPARTPDEDRLEDVTGDPHVPGKFVMANLGDSDRDGVPGFADHTSADRFVPVVLALSPGIDPVRARVRFTYDMSDPAAGTETDDLLDPVYTAAPGHLRLWTKDGIASRNVTSVSGSGGDFIPSGVALTPAQVGFTQTSRIVTLYVEGVRASAAIADQRLRVDIDADPVRRLGFTASDAVRMTVVQVKLSDRSDANRPPLVGGSIAWITAEPLMPRLAASIVPDLSSAVTGISAEWSLRAQFDVDSPLYSHHWDVFVPPAVAGQAQRASLPINDAWDVAAAIAGLKEEERFFGGAVALGLKLGALFEQNLEFRIRGRNPEDDVARGFIDLHNEGMWWAGPIARHESLDPKTGERYNQFVPQQSANAKARGLPFFSGNPQGWGIMQLDYNWSHGSRHATPVEIWNWQTNTLAGIAIMRAARDDASSWMTSAARATRKGKLIEPPRPRGQRLQAKIDKTGGVYERRDGVWGVRGGSPVPVQDRPIPSCNFTDANMDEAVEIKRYNGGYYVQWNGPDNNVYTFDPAVANPKDYVWKVWFGTR